MSDEGMVHPDEGLIRTFLDGEMEEPQERALQEHLNACAACRGDLDAQEQAWKEASKALRVLNHEPDLAEARARLQARLERGHRSWLSLSRAASIAVLLTAAVASALPGSPVQRWIMDGWRTLTGPGTPSIQPSGPPLEAGERAGLPAPSPAREIGASVPVGAGSLEIWIHHLPPDATLRVEWVEGDQVGIFAGEGTRFSTGEGRLEAFSPPGSVRVELPRSLTRALVGVDGEVLLRKSGPEVDISGSVQGRTPSEIVFHPGS